MSRRAGPEPFERHIYLKGTLTRNQVPLALAWALTVHKAQGATIDYLRVDLDGCFADGQAYVAISRVHVADELAVFVDDELQAKMQQCCTISEIQVRAPRCG